MRLADARPSTCRPCLTASPLGSDDSPENGAPQCRHAEFSRDSCIYGEIYEDVRAHGVVLAIEAVHPVVKRVVETERPIGAARRSLDVLGDDRRLVPRDPAGCAEPIAEVE